MPTGIVTKTVEAALEEKYGEGKWIVSPSDHSLYLNRELIRSKNLDAAEVHGVAAEAARGIPHVLRAYTREQLLSGVEMGDELGRRVANGFHAQRGADVYVLLEPYWMYGRSGATHGTAFSYDTHVPIIFMGPGIKAGRYHRKASPNDIAPTLSTILSIAFPSGSTGRILSEILVGD